MTTPEESMEEFDTLFNALGFDHVATCGCFGDCDCVSGREKLKQFIRSYGDERERKAWESAKAIILDVTQYSQIGDLVSRPRILKAITTKLTELS
jgi:hypothetical protein